MTRQRTVLHIAPFLWSGAGSVITRLCEAQRRLGRVVLVTTSAADGLSDWPAYRRRLRAAGVAHHAIDVFHRDAQTFWTAAASLAELIGVERPAVVHAHAGVPTAAAVVAREQAGHTIPVVGQMYSWGPNRPAWMDRMDLWAFGRSDRVVCSARAYERLLVGGGVSPKRLTYLPWGLPLDQLPFRQPGAWRRQRLLSAPGPVLGFVGRLEPRKGQLLILEALKRVRAVHPAATLELVGPPGDAAYEAELRRRIVELGLQDAVTIRGHVRTVPNRLRTWDLFVSASSDEGQGMAVLEAMATGVPVVALVVPGVEDFLRPGANCVGVSTPTSAGVAKAILAALAAPGRLEAFARAGRRLTERKYGWERTVSAFEELYARL